MKTALLKTNQTNNTPDDDYHFTEFENRLLNFAELQGRQNGELNKPLFEEEYKIVFVNTIQAEVQKEINENQRLFLPISGMVEVNRLRIHAEEKIKALKASKFNSEHQLLELQEKKKQFSIHYANNKSQLHWNKIVILIISIIEGFFTYDALRIYGCNIILSVLSSIGIALIIGFSIHIAAVKLKSISKHFIYYGTFLLIQIIAFGFFILLGNLRAEGINATHLYDLHQTTNAIQPTAVSGIYLTTISYLFFLFGFLLTLKNTKSNTEKEVTTQSKKLLNEEQYHLKNIDKIENDIQGINKEVAIKSSVALQNYETALAKENKLISLSQIVTNKYITTNVRTRTDGFMPPFFVNPTQFFFQTFFENSKTN